MSSMKTNNKSAALLVVAALTTGLFFINTENVFARESVSRKGKTWNEEEMAAVAGTGSSMTYTDTNGYVSSTGLKVVDNKGKTVNDGFSASAVAIGGTLNVEGKSRVTLQSSILDKGKIHIGKSSTVTTYDDVEVYGKKWNWTGYKIKDYYTGYTYHTLSSKDGAYNGYLQSDGVLNSHGIALVAGGTAVINKGTIKPFNNISIDMNDENGNQVGSISPAVMAENQGNLKAVNTRFDGLVHGNNKSKFTLTNTNAKGLYLEDKSSASLKGGRISAISGYDSREAINNSNNYSAFVFGNSSLTANATTFDNALSVDGKSSVRLDNSNVKKAIMITDGSSVTLNNGQAVLNGISAAGSEYEDKVQTDGTVAIGIGADSHLTLIGKANIQVRSANGNPAGIYNGGSISIAKDAVLQSDGIIQVDDQDDFMDVADTHASGQFTSQGSVISNGLLVQNGAQASLNGKETIINKNIRDSVAVAAKHKDASVTIKNGVINGDVTAVDSGHVILNNTKVQGDSLYAQGTGSSIVLDGDTNYRYTGIQSLSATDSGKIYIKGGILDGDSLRTMTSNSEDKGIVLDDKGQITTKTGEIFAHGIDTTTSQTVRESKDAGDVTNRKIDFRGGSVIFTDNKYTDNYVASTAGKLGPNTKVTLTGKRIEGNVKDVSEMAETPDVLLDGVMANSQGTSLVIGTAANASHIAVESGIAITNDTQFVNNRFRASSLNLRQGENAPGVIITNGESVSLGGSYEGSLLHVGDEDNYQHARFVVGTAQKFSDENNSTSGWLYIGDSTLSKGKNFYINGDIQINDGGVDIDAGNMTIDSVTANKGFLNVYAPASLKVRNGIAILGNSELLTQNGSTLDVPVLTLGDATSHDVFAYINGDITADKVTINKGAQMSVMGNARLGDVNMQDTSGLLEFAGAAGKEIYTANSITANKKGQVQVENGIFYAPSLRKMTSKTVDGSLVLQGTGVLRTTTGQVFAKGINTSSDKKAKDSTGAGSINNKKISLAGGTVQFTDSRYGEKYLDSARKAMNGTRQTWYTMSGKYVDGKAIDVSKAANNSKVLRDKVSVNSNKQNLVVGYSSKEGRNFTDSGITIDKKKANFVASGFRASKLNLGKYSKGLVITNGRYVTLGGSTNGDLITVDNKKQAVKIAVGLSKNITKNKKEVTKGYLFIGDDAVGINSKYVLNGDITVNKGSALQAVSGNIQGNSVTVNNGMVVVNNKASLNVKNFWEYNGADLVNSGLFKADSFTVKANASGKVRGSGKTVVQNLSLQDNSRLTLKDAADLQVSSFKTGKKSVLNIGDSSHVKADTLTFSNSTLQGNGGQIIGDVRLNTNSTAVLSNVTMDGNLIVDDSSSADFNGGNVYVGNTLTSQGTINTRNADVYANNVELNGAKSELNLNQGTTFGGGQVNIHNGGRLNAYGAKIDGTEIYVNPDGNDRSDSFASFTNSALTDVGIIVNGNGDANIEGGTHVLNHFMVKSGYGTISNAVVSINDGGVIGAEFNGSVWLDGRSVLKGDNLWDVTHRTWNDGHTVFTPNYGSIHLTDQARVDTRFDQVFHNGKVNEIFDYAYGGYMLHGDYTKQDVEQAEKLLSDNGYTNSGKSQFVLLGHYVADGGRVVTDMTADEAAQLPDFWLDNVTVHADDGQLLKKMKASHLDVGSQNDVYIHNGASVFLASQSSGKVITNDSGDLPNVHVGVTSADGSDATGNLMVGDWYYGKDTAYQFGDLAVSSGSSVTLNPGQYTFSNIENDGKMEINLGYTSNEKAKIKTHLTVPQIHVSGDQADVSMIDTILTGHVHVENGGRFYASDSQVVGDVSIGYKGNFMFNGDIQGKIDADSAQNIDISDTTISKPVSIENTEKGHFYGNVAIDDNLTLENSPVMLVDNAFLTTKDIIIKGTGGLYTDTDKGDYSCGSTVTANRISINENNSYNGEADVTMDRVKLTGDDNSAYRLYVDMGSKAAINQLNLSNGNLRVSNNAELTINNWRDSGTGNSGGVIDNAQNQNAQILAKGGTIVGNRVKIVNTDLVAQNNNAGVPGIISHFDGSINNNRIVATGKDSRIILSGRNGSNTVFSPKVALGAANGAKIYIQGGILKADSLRKITSAPVQIQDVNQKADSKNIVLASDGIIQTLTGQLFAKGINAASDSKAKASTGAGNITNDKIDLQKGTVLFDDKRYGEKYLVSAAKTMAKFADVWFTMSGKYVDGKSISPATAMKNERVLRDKVTVNSVKKNMVVGIDTKKKSTFTESGVKIDKNNSDFVSNGFRASKLNLAAGSNGLVITGGKTLTLGGSQSGYLLTAGNKKGKWNIVVGTVKNHLGKSGKTTGKFVLGDGSVGKNAKNSIAGSILINQGSTLEQIGNTISLDTIYNRGSMVVRKVAKMNAKDVRMYSGSAFEGWGTSNIDKLTIMPESVTHFTGNMDTNVNQLIINNNEDVYFGNRLNAKTLKGDHAYIVVTNGGVISLDNMDISTGYFELQGADPDQLINAKSASVSINKNGSFNDTEIHVYPNSELTFGEDAKVYFKNGSNITAESNTDISFGYGSEVHVEADDNKNVRNIITVPEGENTAINISDGSKLVVSNAATDGSVYDLSHVVEGSPSMWKLVYGNDTRFIEGKPVNDDLHYKFEVIPTKTMKSRFAKLMAVNTVTAALDTLDSANPVNTDYAVPLADNLTKSTKARDYIISASHVDTPVTQTVSSLNHVAGLNGLAMVRRGLYSFIGTVGDAVKNHPAEDTDVWANFLRSDEDSNGIDVGSLHDGYKLSYHGAVVGYDFRKTDSSRTGIAIAYADGDSYTKGENSTKNDMKYYAGGMYHMRDYGSSHITFDAGYVHSSNDLSQWNVGQRITASTHGNGITAGIYWDRQYRLGSNTWSPFAGIRYMHLQNDDFTDNLGFRHQSDGMNTWKLPVGVSYEYKYRKGNWNITPRMEIGYSFAMGDKGYRDSFGFGNGLDSFDVDVAENSWFVRPSISFINKDNVTLEAYYKYEKGNDIISKNWGIQVGYKF